MPNVPYKITQIDKNRWKRKQAILCFVQYKITQIKFLLIKIGDGMNAWQVVMLLSAIQRMKTSIATAKSDYDLGNFAQEVINPQASSRYFFLKLTVLTDLS